MYALVFWTKCKTRSVVSENDLLPNVQEGETTFVRYEDGKKYKAKIVKKNRKFLTFDCMHSH